MRYIHVYTHTFFVLTYSMLYVVFYVLLFSYMLYVLNLDMISGICIASSVFYTT